MTPACELRGAGLGLLVLAVLAPAPARATAPEPWQAFYGTRSPTPPIDAPAAEACGNGSPPSMIGRREQLAAREQALSKVREAAPGDRPCLWLAAARRALALGMTPEAVAEARFAEMAAAEADSAAVLDAAQWLRAEAWFASGRFDEAEPIYRAFAAAGGPTAEPSDEPTPAPPAPPEVPGPAEPEPAGSVAAETLPARPLTVLAALRLADAALARGDPRGALDGFAATLAPVAALGVPIGPFVLRAAEAAAAAGRHEDARVRLEQALAGALDEPLRAVARLRLAALLLEIGEEAEGRAQIETVQRADPDSPAGRLAALQLLELDLEAAVREGVARTAGGALRADELADRLPALPPGAAPAVGAYARRLAVQIELLAGRPEAALDQLPALAGVEADAVLGDALALLLARHEATPDCAMLVGRLAPRTEWLLRRAPEPEPLAGLARCEARLLGPAAALELQRAIVRRFGAVGREAVAVDLAEALLAEGRLDDVAAAANERIATGGAETATWRRLRAEVELARGAAGAVAATLDPVFETTEAPHEVQLEALEVLVRAVRSAPRDVDLAERLAAAVETLASRLGSAGGESFGEAALTAGHRLRREGAGPRAAALYALAATALPPGTRRAQAWYWSGVLAHDDTHARSAFEACAAESAGGEWSALAQRRLAIAALRAVRAERRS